MHALNVVFVYGTLKRGLYNSKFLSTGGAALIGTAQTKTKLPLVTDEYYVPYLLQMPGMGKSIQGELYAVNDEVLGKLDELEGVPTYYVREKLPIKNLKLEICEKKGKTLVETLDALTPWVYMMPEERVTEEHLTKEFLATYCPTEHIKHYVPRAQRGKNHISRNLSSGGKLSADMATAVKNLCTPPVAPGHHMQI